MNWVNVSYLITLILVSVESETTVVQIVFFDCVSDESSTNTNTNIVVWMFVEPEGIKHNNPVSHTI